MTPTELADNSASWSLDAGDPTISGWMIAIGYIVCAAFCLKAFVSAPSEENQDSQLISGSLSAESFWLACCIMLFFLGLNKQLDLQTLLTDVLRSHANAYGWYESRRTFQVLFICTIALVSLGVCLIIAKKLKQSFPGVKLAFSGMIMIAGYVVARAASFHHFDIALSLKYHDITLLSLVEPLGQCIIVYASVKFILSVKKSESDLSGTSR